MTCEGTDARRPFSQRFSSARSSIGPSTRSASTSDSTAFSNYSTFSTTYKNHQHQKQHQYTRQPKSLGYSTPLHRLSCWILEKSGLQWRNRHHHVKLHSNFDYDRVQFTNAQTLQKHRYNQCCRVVVALLISLLVYATSRYIYSTSSHSRSAKLHLTSQYSGESSIGGGNTFYVGGSSTTYFYNHGQYLWDHYAYAPPHKVESRVQSPTIDQDSHDLPHCHESSFVNASQGITEDYVSCMDRSEIKHSDNDDTDSSKIVIHQDNLLIVQTVELPALEMLADISSRPNRAYARMWGRDYVRYYANNRDVAKTCVDKVQVLYDLTHIQFSQDDHGYKENSNYANAFYDHVVVLPPDATIVNLDFDLLSMVKGFTAKSRQDAKVPIVTYSESNDILYFNLKHRFAKAVTEEWLNLSMSATCTSVEESLQSLRQAIAKVENDASQAIAKVDTRNSDTSPTSVDEKDLFGTSFSVNKLQNSTPEFVLHNNVRVISTLPMSSDLACRAEQSLVSLSDNEATLQTTADSVCYRYYPRCEVP